MQTTSDNNEAAAIKIQMEKMKLDPLTRFKINK